MRPYYTFTYMHSYHHTQIQSQGNSYLDKTFPELSKIKSATILPDEGKEL